MQKRHRFEVRFSNLMFSLSNDKDQIKNSVSFPQCEWNLRKVNISHRELALIVANVKSSYKRLDTTVVRYWPQNDSVIGDTEADLVHIVHIKQKRRWKRKIWKKKRWTSKEIFAFAWCEQALRHIIYLHAREYAFLTVYSYVLLKSQFFFGFKNGFNAVLRCCSQITFKKFN